MWGEWVWAGVDVGPGLVHLAVDGEGGLVDGPVALDHLAVAVDAMRSDARISPKLRPNGFTQNSSGSSGSRPVRWPATPSLNPKRSKRRKAAAIRCFMCVRSASGESNVGKWCGLRSDISTPGVLVSAA